MGVLENLNSFLWSGVWFVFFGTCLWMRFYNYPYPWNAPGPKRDFMLSLGFALQRANSRMLRNADRRRRLARMSGKYKDYY